MLTLEHIDPRNHDLVCGLPNEFNEVLADSSYNYSKSDYFLPYRVRDHPAPINPGDICEVLIQGEWQVTEFMGEWYTHEALKHSRRRTGLINYKKDSTEMWETRIREFEQRTNSSVIVCSWDGRLSKGHLTRKRCEHTLTKVLALWVAIKSEGCCALSHNRKWAKVAGKVRGEQLRKEKQQRKNAN